MPKQCGWIPLLGLEVRGRDAAGCVLSRAAHITTIIMAWARSKSLFVGVPLAIGPALCFLPALAYLVITPATQHATALAVLTFTILAVAEVIGIVLLVRVAVGSPFDLLTAFSFAALLILLVVAVYTGLFLGALAGRM